MAIYKYDGQQWIDYNQYDTALEIVQKSKNNILYLESLHDSGEIEEELNRIRNQIITIESELSSLEMRTEGIEETLPLKQDELSAGLAIGIYGTTIAVKLQDIAAKLDSVPSGAAITESSADIIRVNNILYYKTQTIVGGMTTYAYEELTNSDLTERIVAQIPTDFKIDESGRLVLVHDSNVIGMGVEIGGIGVTIDAPATATQGTLTATQIGILEASETNYIMFNHEKYYLMDKQHTSGSLTYSHVGADNQVNHIKTFTITLSNLTWVLIDTEIGKSEPPITIVDALPEASEENFNKGKIYTQGELLQYIAKITLTEPVISFNSYPLPKANNEHCVAKVNNDIYVIGGTWSNTIVKIDTTNGNVNVVNNMPTNYVQEATCSAVGSNIYIFGGNNGSSVRLNTILKYDTTNNTITTLSATLPAAIERASAAAVGTDIYIFGGYSGSYRNSILKFDTITETITTLSTTLPNTLVQALAVSTGNNIYIFGGDKGSGSGTSRYFNTILKYDTTNNTITTLSATLPQNAYAIAGALLGNNIYLFGGTAYISANLYYNSILKFDTTTETITTLSTTLPNGISQAESAAVGDYIYVVGGNNDGVATNQILKAEFGFIYQYKTITAE